MKGHLTQLACWLVAVSCIPALSYAEAPKSIAPDNCDQFNHALNEANSVVAIQREGGCSFGPAYDGMSVNFSQLHFYKVEVGKGLKKVCEKEIQADVTIFTGPLKQPVEADEHTAASELKKRLTDSKESATPVADDNQPKNAENAFYAVSCETDSGCRFVRDILFHNDLDWPLS